MMPNQDNHTHYSHSWVNFESQTCNILVYKTKYGPQFQPHLEIVVSFQVNVDN
jgi:hypothetical protein